MANLTFYYGTMESGKTTKLLQDHYNYQKHGFKTLIVKPLRDKKGGDMVVNRIGEKRKADLLMTQDTSFLEVSVLNQIINKDIVLVEEAQFFMKEQIDEIWFIAHYFDIPVIAYGLKNNFKGELFAGSAELFSRADLKFELSVNCSCGKMAVFNARRVNGEFVNEGNEVVIDGEHDNTEYIPLCGDCYLNLVEVKRKEPFEESRTRKKDSIKLV